MSKSVLVTQVIINLALLIGGACLVGLAFGWQVGVGAGALALYAKI